MKVYTRQGDDGTTALLTGERVSKTHSIIVTTGSIDELNSWLGLLRDNFSDPSTTDQIIHVQELLMSIATQITTLPDPKHLPSIDYVDESDVRALEKTIDQMSDQLPPFTKFRIAGWTRMCILHAFGSRLLQKIGTLDRGAHQFLRNPSYGSELH